MSATPVDPRSLAARSVPLGDTAADPYALGAGEGVLFAHERLALAGRGAAASIQLPSGLDDRAELAGAQEWLARVPHVDATGLPGAAVRGFGALPFDRSAPARLVVPEVTFARDACGRCWATLVGPQGAGADALERLADDLARGSLRSSADDAPPGPGPEVVAVPYPQEYARAVERALAEMARGPLRKVVLARSLEARFPAPVDVAAALRRLHDQEPSCTVFAFPAEPGAPGRFFGASPELLVRRDEATVTCHPLAGTVGLATQGANGTPGDEGALEVLLSSAKDRLEHQLVVEAIVDALSPRCCALTVPAAPSLVRLRSVAHLGTVVAGTLRAGADGRPPSVLELLSALHPTPAVGGAPRAEALALIEKLEPTGRGRWAGPVGWLDADGDGRWVIGIRSATVEARTAVLCAGAGIVAGSDPQAELAETTVKLAPVLEALAPGASRLL